LRIIQNSNLAFRCPDNLKKKLEAYAEETDVHVSAIVRTACIALLKQEAPHLFAKLSGDKQNFRP
jgi:predicted transcriptional regulator